MNCRDVEPFFDRLAGPSGESGIPDEMGLHEHLTTCAACQRAVRSLEQWDRQLIRAMGDVAVPNGLSHRLADALRDASTADLISKPSVLTASVRRTWVRTSATVAVACLLVFSLLWTRYWLQPPMLSAANVAMLLQQEPQDMPTSSTLIRRLPHGWSSLSDLSSREWKQTELSNLRLSVVVIPFKLQAKRGQHYAGSLFVIPKSRWTPVPITPVSQTHVQYSLPHAWIVWSEGDIVYVLSMNGPPQLLEQLQRQLDDSHAVL